MAEVTGNLGGEEIILNNAATETTLQQLVSSVALLASKINTSPQGKRTQAQTEREMKRFYQQMVAGNKALSEMTDAERLALVKKKSNTKATEVNTEAVKKNSTAFNSVGKAAGFVVKGFEILKGAINGVIGTLDNVAGMGNSMDSAARSFSAIPGVGQELANMFGAAAGASSRLYETFLGGAQVGANFNGSMMQMEKFATGAGVSLDQFTDIIKTQGENLRFLGEGTAEGSKRLFRLAKDIRQPGGVGDSLARLGFSTQDIIEGISEFNSMAIRGSRQRTLTDQQLLQGTARYLKNLDAVAKATGKQRDEIEKEMKDRMLDAQFRAVIARLNAEDATDLNAFLSRLGETGGRAFKEIIAYGGIAGESGRNLGIINQSVAQEAVALGEAVRRSSVSGERLTPALDKAEANAMKYANSTLLAESATNRALAIYRTDQFGRIIVDLEDFALQNTTIAKERAKQDRDELEQRKRQGQIPSGLNPALIKTFQENIASTSIEFTNILASSRLMTSFMNSFQDYTDSMRNTLVPLYEFLGEKAGPMIEKGFEGLKSLTDNLNRDLDKWLAGSAVLAAAITGFYALRGTPANPMFTFNMNERGGSGGFLPGAEGGPGKKGRTRTPKPKGRFGGFGGKLMGLGSFLSLLLYSNELDDGTLYSEEELMELVEKNKSGSITKLTPEQVKEKDRKKIDKVTQSMLFPADADTGMLDFTKDPQVATAKENVIKVKKVEGSIKDSTKTSSAKTAETAIQELEKQAKAEMEMLKQSSEAKKAEKESTEDNTKEVAKIMETPKLTSQDETEALLLSLNRKMEQLVKIASSQLTVQRGFGNDLFA